MKILFCKNNFAGPISGADEIAVTYATELKHAGHATSVLLVQPPSTNDHLIERLRVAGVPVDTLASKTFSSSLATARRVAIRAMRTFTPASNLILSNSRKVVHNLLQQYHDSCCAYLSRTRPDVMHVLTPDPGAIMLIRAAHATNTPIVYQEVGIPFHPPGFEEVYERFVNVLPLCAGVAALSPRLAHELNRAAPQVRRPEVLPLITLHQNATSTSGQSSERVVFGFSARLEYLKGPIRLLKAFGVAHQTAKAIELRIAGEGSQRDELIETSRQLGVEDKCHLVGVYNSLEERSRYMGSIDVFVLPSLTEGTPNVIIEAMAHGKPIIATAVGGVPDLVTHDVGLLVPPDDNNALAEAMIRLAVDPELRWKMGHAARRKYEQLFTPEVVLPVLTDFYERVVRRHANGHAPNNGNGLQPPSSHPWLE